MEGNFEVYQNGQAVGTVALSREGLYYRFRCRCSPLTESVTRLVWKADGNVLSLGILVPVGGCFGLDTRMAIKKCPGEKPEFMLVENGKEAMLQQPESAEKKPSEPEHTEALIHEAEEAPRQEQMRIVPIREDVPFEALEELKYAVLTQQDGQPAACITPPEEQDG